MSLRDQDGFPLRSRLPSSFPIRAIRVIRGLSPRSILLEQRRFRGFVFGKFGFLNAPFEIGGASFDGRFGDRFNLRRLRACREGLT